MKKIIFLLFLILLISFTSVKAVPGIPCDFYGSVKINGNSAQVGTVISAYIDNVKYGEFTVVTLGNYGLFSVNGDDKETLEKDGGVNGDIVKFKVNGNLVSEKGIWEMGKSIRVNINYIETVISTNNAQPSSLQEDSNVSYEEENNTSVDDTIVNKTIDNNESETVEVSNNQRNQEIKEDGSPNNQSNNKQEIQNSKPRLTWLWILLSVTIIFIIIYLIITKIPHNPAD